MLSKRVKVVYDSLIKQSKPGYVLLIDVEQMLHTETKAIAIS